MTPWVDKAVASGASTHTLVLGTSYYQFLPQTDDDASPTDRQTFGLRQTKTPATSAWLFANWLKDSYGNPNAPLGTVRLLLSPSEYEKQNVQGLVAGGALLPADGNPLQVKLDAAQSQLSKGHINAAISYLNDFISQVQALIHNGRLTAGQGQPLIDDARDIITALGG